MKMFVISKIRTKNLEVLKYQPCHLQTSWQHHYYHCNWHFQLLYHCSWQNSPCKQRSMTMLADRHLNVKSNQLLEFKVHFEMRILWNLKPKLNRFLTCIVSSWNIFTVGTISFRSVNLISASDPFHLTFSDTKLLVCWTWCWQCTKGKMISL